MTQAKRNPKEKRPRWMSDEEADMLSFIVESRLKYIKGKSDLNALDLHAIKLLEGVFDGLLQLDLDGVPV